MLALYKEILVRCLFLKLGKIFISPFLGWFFDQTSLETSWDRLPSTSREDMTRPPQNRPIKHRKNLRSYDWMFSSYSLKGLFHIHLFLWCFFWIPGYVWIPKRRRKALTLWVFSSPGTQGLEEFREGFAFWLPGNFYPPGMPRNATGMKSLAPQKSRPWDRCWWLFIYIYIYMCNALKAGYFLGVRVA